MDMWRLMEVRVVIPDNFVPSRTIPRLQVTDEQWAQVPDVITSAIMDTIGPDVPISPYTPYTYLQADLLPHYVPAYFIAMQNAGSRISHATVFGRAMHLIEAYREWLLSQTMALNDAFYGSAVADEEPDKDDDADGRGSGGAEGKKPSSTGWSKSKETCHQM